MQYNFLGLSNLSSRWLCRGWGILIVFSTASVLLADEPSDGIPFRVPYDYLAVSRDWVRKELELTPEQHKQVESFLNAYRQATDEYFTPLFNRQPDAEGRQIQQGIYRRLETAMVKCATEIGNALTDRQKMKFPTLLGRLTARLDCPYQILVIDCDRTHQMIPLTHTSSSREIANRTRLWKVQIALKSESLRDLSEAGKDGYRELRSEWQRWEPIFRDRFLSQMTEREADAWLAGEPRNTKQRFYGATLVRGEPALLTAQGEISL